MGKTRASSSPMMESVPSMMETGLYAEGEENGGLVGV